MGNSKNDGESHARQSYAELNPLTGLYFNHAFLKEADEFLKSIDSGTHALVVIDIENFKLFNKFYGREEGDNLLIHISECLKKLQDEYGSVAGYLGGDNFCVLVPDRPDIVEGLERAILKGIDKYENTIAFYPVFGICSITDHTESAAVMYDRAAIAISSAQGKYSQRICRYDPDMEERYEEEFKMLAEIKAAIKNEEFTFYAQPQCDIVTGKIVGAESLVRWIHSTKGMVSPGVFIPILEKNGFIDELDRYVWKEVCRCLRSWIDRGYHPVPISINVSRLDISAMDVPAYLKELIRQYELPTKLLKVEITESAYAENSDEIISVVKELRDTGFIVMMDDFGSGYSSLNMLKDVSVDVLKLDMRFLDIGEKEQEEEKGIGILESVVNMARTMGLPIIVEGVENQKQETFLAKMGCRYIQGFYYYRPLPISQFEELLADERKLDFGGLLCRQVESMHVREFLDDNLFDDNMVNNMLGAIAFYEVYENQIEITRVNEQYYQLTGISTEEDADSGTKMWSHVRDDDRMTLLSIFEQAYMNPESGAQGNVHYVRTDGEILWVHLRIFFLRERNGRKLYYGSLVDITLTQQKKEAIESGRAVTEFTQELYSHMKQYFGDMPFGYGVARIVLDDSGKPKEYIFEYINHEMERLCGCNIDRLHSVVLNTFSDHDKLLGMLYKVAYLGETMDYNAYSSMSNRYLQMTFYQCEYGYVGYILRDVTHAHIYKDALNSILLDYREVYFVNLQDNFCRMVYPNESDMLERGNYEEIINRHYRMGKILKEDEQNVRNFLSLENLKSELLTQDSVGYKYRRNTVDDDEWCITSFMVRERDEDGAPKTAIMTIRSIEELLRKEEERKQKSMAEILANMSEGFFVYQAAENDKILYANPQVCHMFGCRTMEEFMEMVQGSFHGMVHPGDIKRVESEINEQIAGTDNQMDYIKYRIVRKDGEVRWINDCGHLESSAGTGDSQLFYVLVSDVTDEITTWEKERLLTKNKYY